MSCSQFGYMEAYLNKGVSNNSINFHIMYVLHATPAKGKLTCNWEESSARWEKEAVGQKFYLATSESDRQVVERVAEVSEKRGVPRAQIALAYNRRFLLICWVNNKLRSFNVESIVNLFIIIDIC
jgi:hypothetical protein